MAQPNQPLEIPLHNLVLNDVLNCGTSQYKKFVTSGKPDNNSGIAKVKSIVMNGLGAFVVFLDPNHIRTFGAMPVWIPQHMVNHALLLDVDAAKAADDAGKKS